MRNQIKILLREGLISEDKLYGKKVIEPLLKKFGDSSDDTINKIAIAGLFRGVFPPIQTIKTKEQLDTEFNTWYNNIIEALIKKTKTFVDDDDLAKKYLDAYVNNIKSLGIDAKPFSIKKVEKTFVDVINNNSWIAEGGGISNNNIYNPDKDDIMYEDGEIVVLNSNTKAKCVRYGEGESWCIGKPELNWYNTYRINYGATPYHVLQKNVDGTEHKIVIMNYGERGYAIADRGNSDRHGDSSQATYWGEIEDEIPNLEGLEEHFPYREVTEDEKRYEEVLERTRGYDGDDLMGYIEHAIKGLVVNGSPIRSEDFIRDYAALGVRFPTLQLKSLNEITMDSLIEAGYFMGEVHGIEVLSDKQKRRVITLLIENDNLLSDIEYGYAPDNLKLKYIEKKMRGESIELSTKQYIDTPDDIKVRYVELLSNEGKEITDKQYNNTPEDLKLVYINHRAIRGALITDQQYADAPDNLKLKYIEKRVTIFKEITDQQYADAPDNLKLKYIEAENTLSHKQLDSTPTELQLIYFKANIKKGGVSGSLFSRFPEDLKMVLVNKLKDGAGHIPHYIFKKLSNEERIEYVKKLFVDTYNKEDPQRREHTLNRLTEWEYAIAPDDYKEKYIRKVFNARWENHYFAFDLTNQQYVLTPPPLKELYITLKISRIAKGNDYLGREKVAEKLSDKLYKASTDDQKKSFIKQTISRRDRLSDNFIKLSSDGVKLFYVEHLINVGTELTDEEYDSISDELRAKYQFRSKYYKTQKQKDDYQRIWKLYNKALREGLLELNIQF